MITPRSGVRIVGGSGSHTISNRFANAFLDASTAAESADRAITNDKPMAFLEEGSDSIVGPTLLAGERHLASIALDTANVRSNMVF